MIKEYISKILRVLGLLKLVDIIWYWKTRIKCSDENNRFRAKNPDVIMPPNSQLYEILGTCSYSGYWSSGRNDALLIRDLIREYRMDQGLIVAEWGCGPARILRHLLELEPKIEFIGFDYNHEMVSWCRRSIDRCNFKSNDLTPPLSVASESLDVFYCVSVFTHLSYASHMEWINEIKRVLKPGGLFIGTFHGDKFVDRLLPEEIKVYNNGELVVRGNVSEGSKEYAAYHCKSFLENHFFRGFVNIHEIKDAPFHQNVWCATKTSTV